jgi:hypothetical protein
MSEADVTVSWIEIYDFIALWHKTLRNRKAKKDFIMQNCSVKKQLQAGKILQCITALWRKRRERHSCLNILIHPLTYAALYYLLIKQS